jgi:hypothetical protein
MARPVAVVTGMIATYPVGGVVWDYGQYAIGLERLGYEVWYLEDTGLETYDPQRGLYGAGCEHAVEFLARSLPALSPALAHRWHYRSPEGRTWGVDPQVMGEVIAGAELFLNVSGSALLRDEYMACRRKVLIDTDPGMNHFRWYPRWDAGLGWKGTHGYRGHNHFFTYAERIGLDGCALPSLGLPWQPTRPPVVLDCWQPEPPGATWTTVMTWKQFEDGIEHDGRVYGAKEMEFHHVEQLPQRFAAPLEVAVGGVPDPVAGWRALGWSVVRSEEISTTADAYRHYVQRSRGEISVAKNIYVATGSGWFSCRSACYLAASRPVVVQDTGFSRVLPTGAGIMTFTSAEEALRALEAVDADYTGHQQAARELAETFFSAEVVLGDLLDRVELGARR